MEDQVQCPNCGGYKVGYQYPGDDGCITQLFLLAGGGGLLMCIFVTLLGISELNLFGIGVGAFLGIGSALMLLVGIAALQPKHTHLLECHLCSYKWDTRSNPQVTVRPDLILKGEERLRAEQEEERKRREQQEAIYWWQQQQKK